MPGLDPAQINPIVREELLIEATYDPSHSRSLVRAPADDFIFAGRIREKPRERNSVRTKILYPAIERANEQLASEDLGEHPPSPPRRWDTATLA